MVLCRPDPSTRVAFISEGDAAGIGLDQPAVGYGDAARVAGEISQHSFRAVERSLSIWTRF